MLLKTIKYTDYNGQERNEKHYFNLTKAELMEMEMGTTGGWANMMQGIIDAQDTPSLIKIFKKLILQSYGEKGADGKSFIKIKDGKKLADDFVQTEAYSTLFMELALDAKAASDFILGIIPAELAEEAKKQGAIK